MFLLNLTWLQFLAVFGGVSAGVVALYLWDRTRRRLTVPTLRFWTAAQQAAEAKHRKRIQQPLSLLLQILSILLLLLALAQLRLGRAGPVSRDHVLILDTSAWMASRTPKGTLMEQAKELARAYVSALPAEDRVMVVRADALATPATAFEETRGPVEHAIDDSRAGTTALDLEQAFEFARQAQRLQGGSAGEVVYVGAERVNDTPTEATQGSLAALRVLPVDADVRNCGIKKIGLHRSASDPDLWEILVSVHNYGSAPRTVQVSLAFSGSLAGTSSLSLDPGADQNATFRYRSRSAGWIEARLTPPDDFPANSRAVLDVPARRPLRVAVYSDEPDLLRPVLAANSDVDAVFRKPAEYAGPAGADIVIFDRFSPATPPASHAVWIEPPTGSSPFRVRATEANTPVARWRSDHPLAEGLRSNDLRLETAQIFQPESGDVAVAESTSGPVVLAREGPVKFVALGFHPSRTRLRYELATPLLFANVLRWMAPDIFRHWELNAGSVGSVTVPLESDAEASAARVIAGDGSALPYTLDGHELRFFASTPGTVRVIAGDREILYSLTLPEVAELKWVPPARARRSVPRASEGRPEFIEIWPWLALAGALGLLTDWILFGRSKAFRLPGPVFSPRSAR